MSHRQHNRRRLLETSGKRSILLELFRSNRHPHLQLSDIVSHVVEFASDFYGSRFLQKKLDEVTDNRRDAVFRELEPRLLNLMVDRFGNFVVQKFVDIGSENHRITLLQIIQTNIIVLSTDKYGCRVVQKIIDAKKYAPYLMVSWKTDDVLKLCRDSNGNHVIQKFFRCEHEPTQTFLFGLIKPVIGLLNPDLYGCRVMQCILKYGPAEVRNDVMTATINDLQLLICDRFGNYVVQSALEHCPDYRNTLIGMIMVNFYYYAQQKYSSNVVEKTLDVASAQMINQIAADLLAKDDVTVKKICLDTYANYVIQKLIKLMSAEHKVQMFSKLQISLGEMTRHVCGRKTIEILAEFMMEQRMMNLRVCA